MIKGLIVECDNPKCKKEFIDRKEYKEVEKMKKHYCPKCRDMHITQSGSQEKNANPEILDKFADGLNKRIKMQNKITCGGIVINTRPNIKIGE